MSDIHNQELQTVDTEKIGRTNLGTFIKGTSGNPKGRKAGSKNRTTLMKQMMEESLVRDIAKDFNAIVTQVLDLAKSGDTDMIKLILNDVLKEARKPEPVEDTAGGPKTVQISITQYFGEPENEVEPIEAEFTKITGEPNG